jgi:predicted Zn-dependent peptidase
MSFNSSKLSSGLNILTYEMPYVNSVSINVIVKVGSRFESEAESGISHFLEHMAFKGTKKRNAEQIAVEFDSIGGHFNAYTSREQTVYYTKVLNEHFKQALDILADILQNSVFNKEDIDKELNVILQEIAGVHDTPDDLAYEKFYELAFKNHPLGRSILGNSDNLANFNKDSFESYLAKHYTADNIYISVAGNIKHSDVVACTKELFGDLPGSSPQNFSPALYSGGYNFTKKKLEQTTIALGFKSVSYLSLREFYSAQIFSVILGGGLSSRLFQRIRENLGLAYGIGSFNSGYCDTGIFSIYAATDHVNVELLLENLIIEIERSQHDITEEELKRAEAQIKSSIYMAEERSEYKSEEIGKNFSLFNRYFSTEEVMNMIMSIGKDEVMACGAKIFSSHPTLSIVGKEPKSFDFDMICNKFNK